MKLRDFNAESIVLGGIQFGYSKAMDFVGSRVYGECGASYECSGGGGQCGASYECSGGGGQCGASYSCSGGGGQCGASYSCSGT